MEVRMRNLMQTSFYLVPYPQNLSSRPPDTFPPESIVTYEVDDHTPPRFQLDGIPVQVGIGWMTQNAGEPNHLFGNILQDREVSCNAYQRDLRS